MSRNIGIDIRKRVVQEVPDNLKLKSSEINGKFNALVSYELSPGPHYRWEWFVYSDLGFEIVELGEFRLDLKSIGDTPSKSSIREKMTNDLMNYNAELFKQMYLFFDKIVFIQEEIDKDTGELWYPLDLADKKFLDGIRVVPEKERFDAIQKSRVEINAMMKKASEEFLETLFRCIRNANKNVSMQQPGLAVAGLPTYTLDYWLWRYYSDLAISRNFNLPLAIDKCFTDTLNYSLFGSSTVDVNLLRKIKSFGIFQNVLAAWVPHFTNLSIDELISLKKERIFSLFRQDLLRVCERFDPKIESYEHNVTLAINESIRKELAELARMQKNRGMMTIIKTVVSTIPVADQILKGINIAQGIREIGEVRSRSIGMFIADVISMSEVTHKRRSRWRKRIWANR